MECRTVRVSLSDYLDGLEGRADESEIRNIEDHLASCPSCRSLQLELTEIKTAARELPLRTPPRALWTRIVNEIEIEQAIASSPTEPESLTSLWGRLTNFQFTFSLPQIASVAALAIVLVTVGVINFRGRTSEMDFSRLQSALIREEMTKKAEIDRKMAQIEERKANWDPAYRADFDRQLNRIEESIKQCRNNLEASPNDLNQVQRMLDLYEEKRQLLEDVERLKW
jgi:hypothetical protein